MRLRLLDLLACPDCGCQDIRLTSIHESRLPDPSGDIKEGSVNCPACASVFPIVEGIPRMLPRELREQEVQRGGEKLQGTLRTAEGYNEVYSGSVWEEFTEPTDYSKDLELVTEYFREFLALDQSASRLFQGRIVLDAGCGGGRFMGAASRFGAAETVGLDLSEAGPLRAQRLLKGNAHFHLVQGDVTRPAFKKGSFDIVYSIGVLHHLAVPAEGFSAVKGLLSPGGMLLVWVYRLEGMSLSYRLSHLVWLRKLTRSWSLDARYRLCRFLGPLFVALYLSPLCVLRWVVPDKVFARLPWSRWTKFNREDVAYAFFDRLQPYYTHFPKRSDLMKWTDDLREVSIESPIRRGWVVKAVRPTSE